MPTLVGRDLCCDNVLKILRKYFAGDNNCRGHWENQSINAGNPNLPDCVPTVTSATTLVIKEVLHCLSEVGLYAHPLIFFCDQFMHGLS